MVVGDLESVVHLLLGLWRLRCSFVHPTTVSVGQLLLGFWCQCRSSAPRIAVVVGQLLLPAVSFKGGGSLQCDAWIQV